ncbi:LPS export ABC transporter periplasmic protein LptC [Balneatrix alpica]|uniref:Lipopolysaccharide export system protein LptC n=1 Tax=Balneatrix alpica TaxID=75684 RepID=A0ABV5ZB49_9GAMM|nr:LPS export ABC transporter periplasmic protein LptC [Balneatrix alpica]
MSLKNRLILGLAMLLAAMALLRFELRSPDQPILSLQTLDGETADAYLLSVHSQRFDTEGKLSSELHSPRIDHFAGQALSLLQTPRFLSYGEQNLWQATSLHGRYRDDGSWLELIDEVDIQRLDNTSTPPRLRTPWLAIEPPNKLAHSDREVTLTDANGITEAIGMRLNWQSEQLELLSQVRARYETKH